MFGTMVGEYPMIEWINAATGWEMTPETLLTTGERILTLRHCFNVREGIKPVDTQMRNRAGGHPALGKGPLANITLDLDKMAGRYYEKLGWDYQTGVVARDRLEALGLDAAIEDLHGASEGT
jgi:aldehyde:ferredoxin oxidoreductase